MVLLLMIIIDVPARHPWLLDTRLTTSNTANAAAAREATAVILILAPGITYLTSML